jgi:hypothetical protein
MTALVSKLRNLGALDPKTGCINWTGHVFRIRAGKVWKHVAEVRT